LTKQLPAVDLRPQHKTGSQSQVEIPLPAGPGAGVALRPFCLGIPFRLFSLSRSCLLHGMFFVYFLFVVIAKEIVDIVGMSKRLQVACGFFQHFDENEKRQLIEGACVRGMILRGNRDSLAGVYQTIPLGRIAAGAGRQNQAEALFGRQVAVVFSDGVRVHRSLSFLPSSTASKVCKRWSRTLTSMARSRASASVAVRRDLSPAGSSAASS